MKKGMFIFSFLITFHFAKSQSRWADSCFHPDSLRTIVEALAADSMKGRLSGSGNELEAADYIANAFYQAGLRPLTEKAGYFLPVGKNMFNVAGVIPGQSASGKLIIFSAHYDHVGTRSTHLSLGLPENGNPEKGDTIYNGANDNASGTAALITLARYWSRIRGNQHTLLFLAFSGEERGLLGSYHFAEQIKPDSVIAVINLEMLGRSRSSKPRPFITGDGHSNLRSLLNKRLKAISPDQYGKNYFSPDGDPDENLFARSDNFPFAIKGIPAHTIMLTSSRDVYYHSLNDEPSTLQFDNMSSVIKAIASAVSGLISGEDTPSRIRHF